MANVPFPISRGKYEVKPGLRKLRPDEQVFWTNEDYGFQIAEKWRLNRHDSPVYLDKDKDQEVVDSVLLKAASRFIEEGSGRKLSLGVRFGMQVQQDLAIVQAGSPNRMIYLHVSFPNGWHPLDKIGRTFTETHAPVAGFEDMAKREDRIVQAMIEHGPFERFAWGIHTTDYLDRYGVKDKWGRWSGDGTQAFLRVERQTSLGVPEHNAALFTIHTFIQPLGSLTPEQKGLTAQALNGMSEASRAYKGLSGSAVERITKYLENANDN